MDHLLQKDQAPPERRATGKIKGSRVIPGELLELLVVYTILLVIETVHGVGKWTLLVACDSTAVLYTFTCESKRAPAGASNTNIRRLLRKIKTKYSSKNKLEHTKGHQDNSKTVVELALPGRLNRQCGTLAKGTIWSVLSIPDCILH